MGFYLDSCLSWRQESGQRIAVQDDSFLFLRKKITGFWFREQLAALWQSVVFSMHIYTAFPAGKEKRHNHLPKGIISYAVPVLNLGEYLRRHTAHLTRAGWCSVYWYGDLWTKIIWSSACIHKRKRGKNHMKFEEWFLVTVLLGWCRDWRWKKVPPQAYRGCKESLHPLVLMISEAASGEILLYSFFS